MRSNRGVCLFLRGVVDLPLKLQMPSAPTSVTKESEPSEARWTPKERVSVCVLRKGRVCRLGWGVGVKWSQLVLCRPEKW